MTPFGPLWDTNFLHVKKFRENTQIHEFVRFHGIILQF